MIISHVILRFEILKRTPYFRRFIYFFYFFQISTLKTLDYSTLRKQIERTVIFFLCFLTFRLRIGYNFLSHLSIVEAGRF